MSARFAAISMGIGLLLAGAGRQYLSPRMTLDKIRTAALNSDLATLNELVDFPSVRNSVKESLKAALMKEVMSSQTQDHDGDASAFAGIAMLFGGWAIDKGVDFIVSPSGIVSLTRGQTDWLDRFINEDLQDASTEASKAEQSSGMPELRGSAGPVTADLKSGYEGISRFVVRISDKMTGREKVVLVLRRNEFSWRLTEVWLRDFGASSSQTNPKPRAVSRDRNPGKPRKKSSANSPISKGEQGSSEDGDIPRLHRRLE